MSHYRPYSLEIGKTNRCDHQAVRPVALKSVDGEIEELVAVCVDDCLDKIGGSFKSIFYWSLENRAGVKRNKIVRKPEEFSMYIDTMFPMNASLVKEEISENLRKELGIPKFSSDVAVLIRYAVVKASFLSR